MLRKFVLISAVAIGCVALRAVAAQSAGAWVYSTDTRAIGTTTRFACTRSRELVVQHFPYHNTRATLCVLTTLDPGDAKPDVLVTIGLVGDGQLDQG